jgi:hypothetical protein
MYIKKKPGSYRRGGYEVWLDIHDMSKSGAGKGILEAMSEGKDNADVMLICVSKECSASANCRLEASTTSSSEYAHMHGMPILYLMMQEGYEKPTGIVHCMLILHAHTACSYCMLILHAHTACSYCMLILHTHTAYSYCILILHTHTACSYCIRILHTHTGWLGMLLGQKLWYNMFAGETDTQMTNLLAIKPHHTRGLGRHAAGNHVEVVKEGTQQGEEGEAVMDEGDDAKSCLRLKLQEPASLAISGLPVDMLVPAPC